MYVPFFYFVSLADEHSGAGSDTSMASIPQAHGCSVIPDEPSNTLPDTFKTKFYPSTGRPPVTDRFSAFSRTTTTPQLHDEVPWHPFLFEIDFKFVEVAHQAALSKEQTETLLKIIWKVASSDAKFSFKMFPPPG